MWVITHVIICIHTLISSHHSPVRQAAIIVPISQIRKVRLSEISWVWWYTPVILAQETKKQTKPTKVRKWLGLDWNPSLWLQLPSVLSLVPVPPVCLRQHVCCQALSTGPWAAWQQPARSKCGETATREFSLSLVHDVSV